MTTTSTNYYDLPSPTRSRPEADPHSNTIRRPSSVASRSTTARRHRSNRSHNGGAFYAPQNEFPNFAHTGDVEIIVAAGGQERRYMLHRLILARSSGFFEASTSEQWSRAQAQPEAQGYNGTLGRIGEEDEASQAGRSSARTTQKLFWRYELDFGDQTDEMPMLVQKVGCTALREKIYSLIVVL